MNFSQAIQSCLNKFSTFKGRAPRSEFWYWRLFMLLVAFIPTVLIKLMHLPPLPNLVINLIYLIMLLALFIPDISVFVRRLHDVGRSGWSFWWCFTLIGLIPLFYWQLKKGTYGDNRFGPDPLSGTPGHRPATGGDTLMAVGFTFLIIAAYGAFAVHLFHKALIEVRAQQAARMYQQQQGGSPFMVPMNPPGTVSP